MSDWFSSFTEEDNYERQAVRTAVLLAKTRYDEQLKPFVQRSEERLGFVRGEIDRIANETAAETGAMRDEVFRKLMAIVTAEVELPVSKPEHMDLEGGPDSLPPARFDDKKPVPQATTDVRDHGTVLEEEILYPDYSKIIPVQEGGNKHGCVRCQQRLASEDSPVCTECETELVALAGDDSPPLAKQADGQVVQYPNQPVQSEPGAQPLNPNAPYRCDVCGFTGTWQAVNDHIITAQDTAHMQRKQQAPLQGQQPTQTSPVVQGQPMQQAAGVKTSQPMPGEPPPPGAPPSSPPSNQSDDNEPVRAEDYDDNTPDGRFKRIAEDIADRAAARHFSQVTDDQVHQIASQYGIDDGEVRRHVVVTSTFGDASATNGKVGDEDIPDDYSEVDGLGGKIDDHEAIVPTNLAVRKAADDLGTDEDTIYQSIKDTMGDDLGDDYHTSVSGEQHFYLPDKLVNSEKQEDTQDESTEQQPQSQPQQPPAQPNLSQQAKLAKDVRVQLTRLERRLRQVEAGVEGGKEV
jgi:hypothetical protein